MKTIALGPACSLPSWHWVGIDTAQELAKYYHTIIYTSFQAVPSCDLLLIIKQHPPDSFVEEALAKQIKVIYLPIDYYISHKQLFLDVRLLQKYHLVLSHCERLIPLLKPYCQAVAYIEHHTKYSLKDLADYKESGYVLWIGGCQYLPYLLRWLRNNPLPAQVKILTDINNEQAISAANREAARLALGLKISAGATTIDDYEVYLWSESLQAEMMRECKAAIDIKDEQNFNQIHKPATKAQKYLASGIPFAINRASYAYEYCQQRGMELATPTNRELWFSQEYWESTRQWSIELRRYTSLESVGCCYKEFIDQTLSLCEQH